MTPLATAFLVFLAGQRLGELALARRNTTRLLEQGAREVAAAHYPLIVALHAAWIVALVLLGWSHPVHVGWLAVFAVLQVFRVWILATLGRRWTTRIIVIDEPLVRSGPFRWMDHPNYALVSVEIVVAPLVLGLPWVALVFGLLNLAVLSQRIRAEEAALSPLRARA